MSMPSGLAFDKKLAGIIVLSGCMPLSADFKNLVRLENKQTRHGNNDPLIKQALIKMSFERLQEMGYNVKMQTYEYVTTACGWFAFQVYKFLIMAVWDTLSFWPTSPYRRRE